MKVSFLSLKQTPNKSKSQPADDLLIRLAEGARRQHDAGLLNGDFRLNAPIRSKFLSQITTLKRASVALILFYAPDQRLHLLLIQRSTKLKHHPGQVGFPGGRREPEDNNSWQTATRETAEEIGLQLLDRHLISPLALYGSHSGFLVCPYACLVPDLKVDELVLDTTEVDRVFSIPVTELIQPDFSELGSFTKKNFPYYWVKFNNGPVSLWGLSAGIVAFWLKDSGFDLDLEAPAPSPAIPLQHLQRIDVT